MIFKYLQRSKVEGEQSLHHLITANPEEGFLDFCKEITDFKSSLLDQLAEYKTELETR